MSPKALTDRQRSVLRVEIASVEGHDPFVESVQGLIEVAFDDVGSPITVADLSPGDVLLGVRLVVTTQWDGAGFSASVGSLGTMSSTRDGMPALAK